MIVFDGIIYSIQQHGGITTYFNELVNGVSSKIPGCELLLYSEKEELNVPKKKLDPRFLERYRKPVGITEGAIFHSSYYRISNARKVKNVITIYDFTYEKFGKFPSRDVHRMQKSYAINNADAILCISESTRQDLFELYPRIEKSRVFVTHLAMSDSFHLLNEDQRNKFSTPFVLFVGGRQGYKNFVSAIGAVALVKDLKLVFVGGGPVTADENKLLAELLPGRFEHKGAISSEALNTLYNTAVALLYPSQYEGFGIPILEAMAAGCSVIATRVSSIPEVSGDSAILLDSPNPEAISEAIDHLMNEENNLKLQSLGAKQILNFGWNITVDQTIAIYQSL
jgi:mannosyltransferase